jgi:hypothetical protein
LMDIRLILLNISKAVEMVYFCFINDLLLCHYLAPCDESKTYIGLLAAI